MDRNTVIVMDWVELALLVPALIIFIWKLFSDKLKGKQFSSDLTTAGLGFGLAVIGVIQLNIDSGVSWASLALLVVQVLLLVMLYRRLWTPFMRKLRGEAD